MTSKDTKRIIEKIQKLFLEGEYRKAVKILSDALDKGNYLEDEEEDLKLQYACAIYHDAFKRYKPGESSGQAYKELEQAIEILKNIVSRGEKEKNIFNAKTFLAQIYAQMGRTNDALKIAKENLKNNPSPLTANRLADVYLRLGSFVEAEKWYKKYSDLASKSGMPAYFLNTDLAVFYKQVGKHDLAKKHLDKALAGMPETPEGKSLLSILRDHFHIHDK